MSDDPRTMPDGSRRSAPHDPEAGHGHGAAVAALCFVAFAVAIHANVLGALEVFLPRELAGEPEWFGILLAVSSYAGAAGALLLGPAFDRLGRRRVLFVAVPVFGLASLAHLVAASDYAAFATARAIAGFAGGVAYAGASIVVADLVPYERRGRAMMIFSAMVFLAVPVGLPLAVWSARAGYWQGIFVVQAVFAVVAFAGLVRYVPSRIDTRLGSVRVGSLATLGKALRARGVVAALVSAAIYSGAFFATTQFAAGWLDDEGILTKARQEWMWITLGVASAGSIALGGLSDRIGKRNFVLATTLLVGLGVFALGFSSRLVTIALIGVPVALLAAARAGALLALMTALVPPSARGSLMGFRSGFIQIGIATMAATAGFLSDAGGFETLAVGMSVAMLVSFALIGIAVPEPGASQEDVEEARP